MMLGTISTLFQLNSGRRPIVGFWVGDHLQDICEDTAVRIVGAAEFHTSLVDLNLTEANAEANNIERLTKHIN